MEPDPVATSAVYVAAPCNDSITASSAAAADEGDKELAAEVKELRNKLARKDDVLRVRNNQLAEISKLLDERESLWNASLARATLSVPSPPILLVDACTRAYHNQHTVCRPYVEFVCLVAWHSRVRRLCAGLTQSAHGALQEPPLLAVMAVVGDYESAKLRERLRKAWYPESSRQALEDCLGVLPPSCMCVAGHWCAPVHPPCSNGAATLLMITVCTVSFVYRVPQTTGSRRLRGVLL